MHCFFIAITKKKKGALHKDSPFLVNFQSITQQSFLLYPVVWCNQACIKRVICSKDFKTLHAWNWRLLTVHYDFWRHIGQQVQNGTKTDLHPQDNHFLTFAGSTCVTCFLLEMGHCISSISFGWWVWQIATILIRSCPKGIAERSWAFHGNLNLCH